MKQESMKQAGFFGRVLMVLMALSWATLAQAADIAAGQKKAEATCVACHGAQGNKPIDPSYPKLAGQHQDYLVQALHAYQSGARKNPIMGAQAATLSSKEINDLAAYYAAQKDGLQLKK